MNKYCDYCGNNPTWACNDACSSCKDGDCFVPRPEEYQPCPNCARLEAELKNLEKLLDLYRTEESQNNFNKLQYNIEHQRLTKGNNQLKCDNMDINSNLEAMTKQYFDDIPKLQQEIERLQQQIKEATIIIQACQDLYPKEQGHKQLDPITVCKMADQWLKNNDSKQEG